MNEERENSLAKEIEKITFEKLTVNDLTEIMRIYHNESPGGKFRFKFIEKICRNTFMLKDHKMFSHFYYPNLLLLELAISSKSSNCFVKDVAEPYFVNFLSENK